MGYTYWIGGRKAAIQINGEHYNVEAGVVNRLPVSILVG